MDAGLQIIQYAQVQLVHHGGMAAPLAMYALRIFDDD
jgi:hypothetical protein